MNEGLAGHLGFMSSSLSANFCGSGRSATIESIASGRAAEAAGYAGFDARAVFAASADGQDWADRIVERSTAAIARRCANLRTMLGIEQVVLGGSIGLAQGYIARVQVI